jgi:hypothetical protein
MGLIPIEERNKWLNATSGEKGLDPEICITGCKLATSLIVSKHELFDLCLMRRNVSEMVSSEI